MSTVSVSLDKWRDYFSAANSDIFTLIEHAIMVAASDCPHDFKEKRDRIAELLFTCNRAELSLGNGDSLKEIVGDVNGDGVDNGDGGDGDGDGDGDDECKNGEEGGGSKDSKESKVISNNGDDGDDDGGDGGDGDGGGDGDDHTEDDSEANVENGAPELEYDDAAALSAEIDEETQFLEEVVRIREILDEREDKSEEVLFESLRRLQLMPLSVDVLKATEIGKTVNALRRHGSREIRNLARQLVEDWKEMVDAWVITTNEIAESADVSPAKTPGADNEDDEEEGLPSPPLDAGAFFANPASFEWSQFFDGMDDDGNLQNSGESDKNRRNGRVRVPERTEIPPPKLESPKNSRTPPKESKAENRRTQESAMKRQSPPCKPSTPVRPKPRPRPNPATQRNATNVVRTKENVPTQRKPLRQQQEKLNQNNEASHQMKLEVAKRKLHERYQEAENAKKQRTIQLVELRDLPKQSLGRGNQHMRRRW